MTMSNLKELPEILTVSDVADYLKVSTRTVTRLIKDNKLKKLPVGRIRIHKIDLLDFLDLPEAEEGGVI